MQIITNTMSNDQCSSSNSHASRNHTKRHERVLVVFAPDSISRLPWPGWGYLGYCSTMDTRMSWRPGYFRLPHIFMYERGRGAAKNQTFSILLSQSFMHALPQQKNQHFEPPVTQSALVLQRHKFSDQVSP